MRRLANFIAVYVFSAFATLSGAADLEVISSITSETSNCGRILSSVSSDPKVDYFGLAKRFDAYYMTSPFTVDGQFNEKVAPDVLYSWMDEEKLNEILAQSNPEKLLPILNRPHFLWRTPMGSFGYGNVSVRLKLKEGVHFALIPHMHPIYEDYETRFKELKKTYDLNNTVFVSEIPVAGYHEYYVFGGGPIHSLSIGTQEHLLEMTGEAHWISTHNNYRDFDLIFKVNPDNNEVSGDAEANLTKPIKFDNRVWSRDGLQERIKRMREVISHRPHGVIIFSSDTEPKRNDHFNSKLKPYWVR